MQIIKSLTKLFFFICPFFAAAQTTFLQQGDKTYQLLERLEIKGQKNTLLNFSNIKPFSRKALVPILENIDSINKAGGVSDSQTVAVSLTKTDEYNLHSFLMNNSEWVTGNKESFLSRKPILKTFYKTKPNLVEVDVKDFFLAINPVLQLTYGKESGNDEKVFVNSRGITLRGLIAKKIGFSTTLTENQERGPLFFRDRITSSRAVPGYGYYKSFKSTGVDYFDARGYVTFNVTKYIDVQFGHDKNFIGNGYRCLFLSDWGNSYLFLKLNTRIWKLNYENIFMELMPQFIKSGDHLLDRKYQATHHLSFDISKSVTVGLFEAVTFGRRNHFDFQYLNPIIFYRHIEGTVGSPDNAVAGLDFKANVAHRLQFYGQFLLDEFILKEVKNNPTSWVNKYGIQAGVKYIDAIGVKNLDVQLETNRVRPFTYSHNDTIANYTHYNQPLAHPLGANFQEVIGIIDYQPAPRWYVYAKAMYYKQGRDTTGGNFGGNIFKDYTTRLSNDGFEVGGGRKSTCLNGLLQVSYELRENLFLDVSLQPRKFKLAGAADQNSTLFSAGVRLNMFKREYDY